MKTLILKRIWLHLTLLGCLLAACAGNSPDPVDTLTPIPNATLQAVTTTATLAQDIPTIGSPAETVTPITPAVSPTSVPPSASPTPVLPTETSAPPNVTSIPDGKGFQWKAVVNGLTHPITITNAADGSNRLFVIEQPGTIRIIQGGLLLAVPFLDIRERVGSNGSERGLLGLAFHPNYKESGLFYINYTDKNGDTTISRFKVGSDPNQADPASEKILLHIQQPYANHNGGNIVFGPDGYLYIGMGDGGSQGDPHGNGQSLQTLLGKLLRIDVDHGDPYAIPAENPLDKGGGRPEILAYGLRNPWRFSFDPPTGNLYIADVGQDKYEEIDILPAGTNTLTNFGWNIREGLHPYSGAPYSGAVPLTNPVFEYDHSQGCAVIGGFVYHGPTLPELHGVYFLADNCTGYVWGLLKTGNQWANSRMFMTNLAITTFGLDETGELYIAAYDGTILRLEHS